MEKRATGELESDVLAVLWSGDPSGMTAGQVRDEFGGTLAYTTVMTILARLWRKGLAERSPAGRAFAYRPKLSEAELAAQRMREQLQRSTDRSAALSRFVGELTRAEEKALRRALDELGRS